MILRRLLATLIAFSLLSLPSWADTQPRMKRTQELFGWSGSTIPDLSSAGTVTGTDVAFTNLVSCGAITTDAGGNFVCSPASGGSGTVTSISQGTNMSFSVTPITTTGTINLTASPSVTNLTASVTVTGAVVSASSALQVGSDYISDITGTGLTVSAGALNANCVTITGSADLCDGSDATGSGGDSIFVNTGTAAVDANFLDGDVDWSINTAVNPDDITATVACTGCIDATDMAADSVGSSEVIESESYTVANLTASATVTGLVVSATSALQVGSDYITDITGTNLSIVAGALTSTSAVAADSLDFTEFKDAMTLDAATDINTAAFALSFTCANPGSGCFDFNGSGAYTGDLVHIHQHTGNPGVGRALDVESTDQDVSPIVHITQLKADLTANVYGLVIEAIDEDDANWIPLAINDNSATPEEIFKVDYSGSVWMGDPGSATVVINSNLSGATDPTITFGNALVTVGGSLTSTGTVTGVVVNATSALQVGSDYISDITGADLSISSGALTVDTLPNLTGTLDVDSGGTGVATLAANGVLYGNTTGVVQVTTQGAANTVLTANAGAPSFSASPTVTNITATGTVTGAVVSATGALQVGSDYFSDITGTGLIISGGTLAASCTAITGGAGLCDGVDADSGGSTAWSAIGDAAGVGTVDFAGFDQDIISAEEGGDILTITNTDAARAGDSIILVLADNDSADVNDIFLKTISDADGTPVASFTLRSTTTAGAMQMNLGATGVTLTDDEDGALTITGNGAGFDEDLTINLDDTANEITISTSTAATLFNLAGALDLKISGDDLFMTTNTSGAVLVADGTNFNPVVMSGDASIGTTGVVAVKASPIILLPQGAVLDDGAPPDPSIVESTGTGTSRRHVLDFDPTTDQIVYWTFVVPQRYVSGNISLVVSWYSNDTGANEDACWGAAISATTEGDADTMAEDAVSTIDYACEDANATEVNRLVQTTITLSDLDSVAPGDVATIAFRRDADNTNGAAGGDGLSSDARLIGVEVRFP